PSPARAWGPAGHRLAAARAQARLHPTATAEVARLLAGEPVPTLAGVANWADDQREIGGQQAAGTRRWHYLNFAAGNCEYVPARDCPDGNCAVAAINRQFLRLADRRRNDQERREALKFLVHLVADVHQPLHATPVADHGGNDFQVAWHGKGSNLHKLWDGTIVEQAMKAQGVDEGGYARWLQARPPLPPDPTRRSDRPAVEWAQESCRVVRDGQLYPASHVLGDDYLVAHRGQAEQRLRLAGARLADMLNFALDPPRTTQRP
ncbi:MAG: S1/P1 nuclease, partial [Arenimonas sp.]